MRRHRRLGSGGRVEGGGNNWFRDVGGVKPTLANPGTRVRRPLTQQERETIALRWAEEAQVCEVAAELRRRPS